MLYFFYIQHQWAGFELTYPTRLHELLTDLLDRSSVRYVLLPHPPTAQDEQNAGPLLRTVTVDGILYRFIDDNSPYSGFIHRTEKRHVSYNCLAGASEQNLREMLGTSELSRLRVSSPIPFELFDVWNSPSQRPEVRELACALWPDLVDSSTGRRQPDQQSEVFHYDYD